MERKTVLLVTVFALLALAVLLVVTGFHPYGKTSNVHRDWAEEPDLPFLWNSADLVVKGTVADVGEPRWSTEDGEKPLRPLPLERRLIYRPVEVNVSEAFRGNASGTVRVLAEGGSRNGYTLKFNDQPRFEEGEDVVLFLSRSEPGRYMDTYRVAQSGYRVVTGSNGKYRLRGGVAESSYGEFQADAFLASLRMVGAGEAPDVGVESTGGHPGGPVETVAAGLTEHSTQLGPGEARSFTFRVVNRGDLSGEAEVEVHRVESVGKTEEISPSGNISVEPVVEEFDMEQRRNASFDLAAKVAPDYEPVREEVTVDGHTQTRLRTDTSTYLVTVRAGNETFRDWLRVMAIDDARHVPGWSGLDLPHVERPDAITVGPDSSETVDLVLRAGESPPGVASLGLHRVAEEYSEEEVPMPDAVSVQVEPERRLVSPHRNYTFRVTASASSEVSPGTYWLRYQLSGPGSREGSWLELRVE